MFQAHVTTCSRTSSHPSDTTDLARVMIRRSESVACNHNRMHVALSHADTAGHQYTKPWSCMPFRGKGRYTPELEWSGILSRGGEIRSDPSQPAQPAHRVDDGPCPCPRNLGFARYRLPFRLIRVSTCTSTTWFRNSRHPLLPVTHLISTHFSQCRPLKTRPSPRHLCRAPSLAL